jgi:hypothetical protein
MASKTKPKSTKKAPKQRKEPFGRPTKYDSKYCQMLIEYCDKVPYSEVDVLTTDKRSGKVYVNKELRAVEFPTLEKFAHDIGVNTDTLVEWSSAKYPDDYADEKLRGKLKHPNFSAAYRRAKQLQKHILVTNGLMGLYNSNFAKFVATNSTDMHDRQEIDHTTKGESMNNPYADLTTEQLRRLAEEQDGADAPDQA